MKTKLLKSTNVILSFLLSMLGFSTGCDEIIHPRAEYGTPYADFIINGTVKASDTNEAIPDIKVKADWDSTYTNAEGKYEIVIRSFPQDQDIEIHFIDPDGNTNGSFQQLDTIAQFKNIEFKSTGSWSYDDVEKEMNVSLEKSDDEL